MLRPSSAHVLTLRRCVVPVVCHCCWALFPSAGCSLLCFLLVLHAFLLKPLFRPPCSSLIWQSVFKHARRRVPDGLMFAVSIPEVVSIVNMHKWTFWRIFRHCEPQVARDWSSLEELTVEMKKRERDRCYCLMQASCY